VFSSDHEGQEGVVSILRTVQCQREREMRTHMIELFSLRLRRVACVALVIGGLAAAGVGVGVGVARSVTAVAPTAPFHAIGPVVARKTGDAIPSSVRTIKIAWTGPRRGALRVTARTQVTRTTSLLNALPQEGGGTCSQGDITGPPYITFSFVDGEGALLGSATEINSTKDPIAYCVPTTFRRAGYSQVELEGGGYFLRHVHGFLRQPLG
jgi:hypothetical protein